MSARSSGWHDSGVTHEPEPGDDHRDPRLEEQPEGSDEGMPGEVIDTDHNMPGQQGPPPRPPEDGPPYS